MAPNVFDPNGVINKRVTVALAFMDTVIALFLAVAHRVTLMPFHECAKIAKLGLAACCYAAFNN